MSSAVFSRLLPTIGLTYGLQSLFGLIFIPLKEERAYDLCGAIGFSSSAFFSLYWPALRAKFLEGRAGPLPSLSSFAGRQVLGTLGIALWSARLATFLFPRALKAGGDSRFDDIKHDPKKFAIMWLGQATWITIVGLPVYLVNSVPANLHPALSVRDYIFFGLFATSLLLETLADEQKSAWRRRKQLKQHDEQFISSGLWGYSRHPNYVAEVAVHTSLYLLSTGSLVGAQYPRVTPFLAATSPLFTYLLLTKVTGVPPLERAAHKKWKNDPKWQEYKRTVPVFWPWSRA